MTSFVTTRDSASDGELLGYEELGGDGEDQRTRFYRVVLHMLDENPRLALVLADIGVSYLEPAALAAVKERVVNVGIREQLMIGVAGGLALAGMRPIVHTFVPFLLERPFEQVKLDLGHQGVGAVLVSAGGSYGWPTGGETHFGRRDVALLDTLDGWTVHVPGHPDEVEVLLDEAARNDDRVYLRLDAASNAAAHDAALKGRMAVMRRGSQGSVIAAGPMLDRVLRAAEGLDLTILYAATVRPFDAATLRETLSAPDVAVVEPYLAGSSTARIAEALQDVPHRVLGLGVRREELRRYGTAEEHDAVHGLDRAGIRAALLRFFGS
jgi:transketolase